MERLVRIGLVLALTLSVSGASRAHAEPTARLESVHSDLGYIGCFISPTNYEACLVAYAVPAGVRVVFTARIISSTLMTGRYVEDLVLPSNTLRAIARNPGFTPAMEFEADLPRTGHVFLRSNGTFATESGGNLGCPQYSVKYELVLEDDSGTIDGGDGEGSGSIAGENVRDKGCNAYWVGQTSGFWSLIVAQESN